MDHQSSKIYSAFSRLISDETAIMTVLGIIIGLAGGFGAIGFRYLIGFFQAISYGSAGELLDVISSIPWYFRIGIPALGGLVIGPIVYFLAREAKGHGVPEVMEAVAMQRGIIRKRIVSANRMRVLVGCGAAAGIAATFNAPIAGFMFALEIILGEFGVATFSPVIISAVTATAVSRHFLGNSPAFVVPAYQLVSLVEFPLYAIMGLFCALAGVTFTTLLYRTEDIFDNQKFPDYLKAALGGLILGAMGLLFPHILGIGYGAINLALVQELSWWLMFLLAIAKILATSITIGSGGSGGIFAPSLFVGAMAGGFFGGVVHHLFPAVTASPGAYSIVGMGAVVAATTHGPLTAILMLFEMTGDYKIILPLMITCIISRLIAGRLLKESIYTFKLLRRGVDIRAGQEVNVLKSIQVKDVMNPEVETIAESLSLREFAEKISKTKYRLSIIRVN